MSKFIIGNKPISRVSGPVRVTVLKPDDDLKKRFEEEGARLPYIILFGDHHFSRENSCDDCKCKTNWITGKGWENKECCYDIDDPEFLKLFDGVASKNYPIDFYTEQDYEPRLSDPDIYNINPSLKGNDDIGYLSKFIHDYKICYSKQERRTPRYKKECPTRDIRWHYIDTRSFRYGKSGEAQLNQGIVIYYHILKIFFNEPEETIQEKTYNTFAQHHHKLQMTLDILLNGLNFLQTYVTIDSDFLIPKQVRKQAIEELRSMDLWNMIIKDTINAVFKRYYTTTNIPFNVNDYMTVMRFYINVLQLISDKDVSKEEFLERRKDLIESVEKYKIFEDNQSNLNNMIFYTTKTAMMDVYTVARMLKKPKGDKEGEGTPGYLAMYYAGDFHVTNIRDILVRHFSYEIVGESYNEKERCQSVKDINFDILKAKKEYM
jgi:hypothetical protein